jgi:Mg/Co/Ni transporter MgtE
VLARDLFDRPVGDDFVVDVAIEAVAGRPPGWGVAALALGRRSRLRARRNPRIVHWAEVPELFATGETARAVAALRALHPSDVASRVREMPEPVRREIAAAMGDHQLADLLEELPEDEQIELLESLDIERAAAVVEYMEPDDAADLLGEMTEDDRTEILEAMDEEEASEVRRLLTYAKASAGGLMTSDPVVLTGDATVADALAVLREPELEVALAAQVFVVEPPTSTPTGRFLGAVGFQRMLREAPWMRLADLCDDELEYVNADLPDDEVAVRLAAYDMVALAVCDDAGRLIGAVTVDDVLDHLLPDSWRQARSGNLR